MSDGVIITLVICVTLVALSMFGHMHKEAMAKLEIEKLKLNGGHSNANTTN